jgi:hypothetical protein
MAFVGPFVCTMLAMIRHPFRRLVPAEVACFLALMRGKNSGLSFLSITLFHAHLYSDAPLTHVKHIRRPFVLWSKDGVSEPHRPTRPKRFFSFLSGKRRRDRPASKMAAATPLRETEICPNRISPSPRRLRLCPVILRRDCPASAFYRNRHARAASQPPRRTISWAARSSGSRKAG